MIIIGHRGASGEYAENTRTAFEQALKLKLEMLEFDVHLTKDQVVVVNHDYTMTRQTGVNRVIRDSNYDQLRSLNMANYRPGAAAEQILTLDQVFEIVPPEVMLNVEIKNLPFYGNAIVEPVLETIQRHNRQSSVLLSSFDHNLLADIARCQPEIKIGVLTYANLLNIEDYITRNLGFEVYSVHLNVEMANQKTVTELLDSGYQVFVYTVNSEEHYQILKEMGVSGIFTDYPKKFGKG